MPSKEKSHYIIVAMQAIINKQLNIQHRLLHISSNTSRSSDKPCIITNRDTNQNYSYRIGQLIVPSVSCFTDLGVSYDDKLRFKPHIDQMVAKSSLHAQLVLKCFQSRNPKLLTRAFFISLPNETAPPL